MVVVKGGDDFSTLYIVCYLLAKIKGQNDIRPDQPAPLVSTRYRIHPATDVAHFLEDMDPDQTETDVSHTHIIEELIEQLAYLRKHERWREAAALKTMLLQKHSIRVFCRNDDTIVWGKIQEKEDTPREKKIVWSVVDVPAKVEADDVIVPMKKDVPLIIATVDALHYQSRLAETLVSVERSHDGSSATYNPIKPINLLSISDNPSIPIKRIVFEGWLTVLLPALSALESEYIIEESFILVAEDDVRFATSPERIRDECSRAFNSNPDLHILSLGHQYVVAKPNRRHRRRAKRQQSDDTISTEGTTESNASAVERESSLLEQLRRGKGLHGSTLLAIRHPEGVQSLLIGMESISFGKRGHFDQYLFLSTLHDVGLAFSDPPLAGWADVDQTLTPGGCRKKGGGRRGYLPVVDGNIQWVRRSLLRPQNTRFRN